jgi:antitoxin MazE
MKNVVKSHLVRIGNSRGVRIPKLWIDQLNLKDEVEMAVEADQLVIRPTRHPRDGWEEQFRLMHERGDDRLIEGFPTSDWDDEDWEW